MRTRWRVCGCLGTIPGMFTPPELSPVELYRLIANMIRTGRVEDVRAGSPARCTVRLGEELVTTWVPWYALAAGGAGQTRHWRTPAQGEPCVLFSPEGDLNQAIAFPGLFSIDMPQGAASTDVERHDFSSTDFWEHHRPTGTLRFEITSAIELQVGASMLRITPEGTTLTTPDYKVDSPNTEFTGAVTIQKLLSFNGGIAGKAGAGGSNVVQGGMQFEDGQITHNGKRIDDGHTHPDPHGGNTGVPN